MLGLALGLAFLSGFGLGAIALVFWAGLGLLAVARQSLSFVALLVILLTASIGALEASVADDGPSSTFTAGSFEGMLLVEDGPFLTRAGQRFTATGSKMPGVRLCVYADAVPSVLTGDRIFATGSVATLEDLSEIGRAAATNRDCDAQFSLDSMTVVAPGSGLRSWISRVRVNLSSFLMRSAPGDAGALLSGLVTGEDGGLSQSASRAFLNSGTTHITAISGANFATLTLLLGVMASGALKRRFGFVLAATALIWLYAAMVGLEPSALRAALLATAVLVGKWIGRRPDLLTLTVLLAAVQIAIRPHDFHTLAFQLSLAATVALILVFDGSERNGERSWGVSLVSSVCAAQLATIPILAWHIGTLSTVGLGANLIVGPLAGFAFPIALAGALIGQVFGPLGELFLLPSIWLCRVIVWVVEWSDQYLPGAVELGEPTILGIAMLTLGCWATIVWMSGDLRRSCRHGLDLVRSW
jgi:competence protein ComEC